MMSEFHDTSEFALLQGRRWKWISKETAEEIALVIVERTSGSRSSTSAGAVSFRYAVFVLLLITLVHGLMVFCLIPFLVPFSFQENTAGLKICSITAIRYNDFL